MEYDSITKLILALAYEYEERYDEIPTRVYITRAEANELLEETNMRSTEAIKWIQSWLAGKDVGYSINVGGLGNVSVLVKQ